MRLKQLQIQNFRNLESVDLNPTEGVNLIVGKNASGKTSLLEAIYYLSHLRSFRTKNFSDIVQREKEHLQLIANISTNSDLNVPLGILRSKNSLEIRANRKAVKKAAEITSQFPVIAIHPDSYQLITGSPSERRSYLDWGVFHVEQGFFKAWQRYKVALSQRNAALKMRQNKKYCMSWDKELIIAADIIDKLRNTYFDNLLPILQEKVKQFFPNTVIEFEYRRGWSKDLELTSILENNIEKDQNKGFTYSGPHRADLVIKVDGYSAQTGISRGQQKLLVALLRLSQAIHYSEHSNKHCVLLYDDLAAELDRTRKEQVLSVLAEMKIQLFLTSIEENQLDLSSWEKQRMFHVEHGVVNTIQDRKS